MSKRQLRHAVGLPEAGARAMLITTDQVREPARHIIYAAAFELGDPRPRDDEGEDV